MKTHNPKRLILQAAVLLIIPLSAWAISACTSSGNLPLLTDIFVSSCDKNTVLLSGFWWLATTNTSTPPVPTQPTPAIDPLGGYLFVYWVDDQGNVCHGQPGVSGQPGPYEIPAYNAAALSAAQQGTAVSDAQFRADQEASFDISAYLKDFKPSGFQFVQFAGWIWQDRKTNKAFIDTSRLFYALPQVGDVSKTFCYLPAYPANGGMCDTSAQLKPATTYVTTQNPNLCKKLGAPTTDVATADERVQYCLSSLPHGLEPTSKQP